MGERIFEVFIDDEWLLMPIFALKVGDKFRLFDNGVRFMDSYGQTEWTVKSVPAPNQDGILYVETEEETI